MNRTVAYVRVSTDEQVTINQTNEIKNRYGLTTELVEEIESGAKELVALKKLCAELTDGDTLVVNAIDRLGRDLASSAALIKDLVSRNIRIISIREGIDYSTAMGQCLAGILASIAQLERVNIIERTKAALRQRREAGYLTCRPTEYGEDCRLRAVALHEQGLGVRAIAVEIGCSVGTAVNLCKCAPKKEYKRKEKTVKTA